MSPDDRSKGQQLGREALNYWPALLDLTTSSLMVFVLVLFLRTNLSVESLEAAFIRNRQDLFLSLFEQELARELKEENVAVERSLDFLQITFSDRVLFEPGQYRLEPRGRRLLERCADVFIRGSEIGYRQLQVEGHTDNLPLHRSSYPADNWELSTARAIEVVQFLSSREGLKPGVFSANGYAHHRPVSSNASASGRARNRRIEIRLFFASRPEDTANPASHAR